MALGLLILGCLTGTVGQILGFGVICGLESECRHLWLDSVLYYALFAWMPGSVIGVVTMFLQLFFRSRKTRSMLIGGITHSTIYPLLFLGRATPERTTSTFTILHSFLSIATILLPMFLLGIFVGYSDYLAKEWLDSPSKRTN
jgi:hypothetical protein